VRPHVDLRYATHYDSETSDHADEESSHPGGFVLRQCIELLGLTHHPSRRRPRSQGPLFQTPLV